MSISDLDKMRLGTKYRFTIQLRDWVGTFRALSVAETSQVATDVLKKLQEQPHLRHIPATESALYAIKTLALASSEAPGAPYQIHEATLETLTPDELTYLWKCYLSEIDRVNPLIESVDDARLKELMAAAKKNHGVLIDCSLRELVGLCRMALTQHPDS